MKKSILLIGFLALSGMISAQDNISISPAISSVTLYLNGAEITHSAPLTINPGRQTFVFKNLSSNLNPRNLRLSVPPEVNVLSVTPKKNFYDSDVEPNNALEALTDSIEKLDDDITMLDIEKKSLVTSLDLLNKNMNIGKKDNPVSTEDLKGATDYFAMKTKEINDKIFVLNKKIDKKTAKQLKLEKKLAEMTRKVNRASSEVEVEMQVTQKTTIDFKLSYLVDSAGWVPIYDVKAKEINLPIQFNYKAKIYNISGIDWKNVKLKLSTGDPSESASKPVLSTWNLDFNTYDGSYGYNQPLQQQTMTYQWNGNGNANMNTNNLGISNNNDIRLTTTAPTGGYMISTPELNAEFDIAIAYTIPTSKDPFFIDVKQYEVPAKYEYISIPKIDRDAFLIARIADWEDMNIVDGMASIYFGGTYVGQSFINTRSISDTLDISLGRDNKVFVTRTKRKEFSSKKIIGSTKKENMDYEISVKNNRTVPIDIEILDQLPISSNSDIKVDVDEISGAVKNDLTGKLTWKFNIAPGEVKKVRLAFSVKYPSNREVNVKKGAYRNTRFL